ncbi:MAG: NAD-dependent epimerase/dehydratase family protein [Chloroflexaceae bacterium]
MRVLVTGGAGFIGSHLVNWLVQHEHNVRVIDNLSSGNVERLAQVQSDVELIVADIRDTERLTKAVAGVEVVFHLAAMVSVVQSIEAPLEAQEINATGTLRLLEIARQAGVRRVVQASTCAVYGNNTSLPITEAAPPQPLSPYAATKLAAEQWGQLYTALYGLEVVATRFFNVYGPGQDPRSLYAAVVPRFIERLVAGKPVTIFGDGCQSRDFVYVGDIIEALWAVAVAPAAAGAVLNVGSGVATSVQELAEAIAGRLGKELRVTHAPARPGEVRHSRAAVEQLTELTGYRPATSLRQGLESAIAAMIPLNG